ncbi:hypothetical protein D9M70_575610 [compost metagenome]
MNRVSSGGARHGPMQVEDQTRPVGVPRSSASNHSARALAADGNIGASPMPSNTRSPRKLARLLERPNAAWATDQKISDPPSISLLPNRSMMMPMGSCEKA